MLEVIASLFGYVLNYIYGFIQNYGLAIILFTILLKVIMLPITIWQQKSMKKSAKIQQEVSKLQVKYKNDQEKLNQEVMSLYKREHSNPLSGCLGSILQFIIFISVFYLVSRPLTYMKKIDKDVINNYQQEVIQEGEKASYPEIKIIAEKSSQDENVNINMGFLGLNLSKVPSQNWNDITVFIIPVLYVIVTFVNIKISTNMTNKKKEKEDNNKTKDENGDAMESMQGMTKSMNYLMPIMSVAIALIAPLGLSLYWLVSNILQLVERLVIDKVFDKKKEEKEVAE